MKKVWKAMLLAGISAGMLMAANPIMAAGPQGGRNCQAAMNKNCVRAQTQCGYQARLRDGSCPRANQAASGSVQKKGNTYGPGDGAGNDGNGPKDGTGNGSPAKR